MFSEMEALLALKKRFTEWWGSRYESTVSTSDSVAARFVRLFEAHGVHRNQIPRFFGCQLTVADFQSDEILLPKLTEEMLDAACVKFSVRREWLDGAVRQVHPTHDFYKWPKDFEQFLLKLKRESLSGCIRGRLVVSNQREFHQWAVLVLEEVVGYVGNKSIYRYHVCNNWLWPYWKARAYLAACVATAWQNDIAVHGVFVEKSVLENLMDGCELLGWKGEGMYALHGQTFHPEDLALRPDAFLEGVDPGRDGFGIEAGLKLWVKLSEQGWMNTGLPYHVDAVKAAFSEALVGHGSAMEKVQ